MSSQRVTSKEMAERLSATRSAAMLASGALPSGPFMGDRVNERGILWIDGVGGYLLCLGDAVTLGQSVPGSSVTIPILADLSRHHATIYRSGEGYILEPLSRCSVEGRACHGATPLHDGNEIRLGAGVEMRFQRPHPLSPTVRLEMISSHRMQPSVDGVVLMAGSCLLGPNHQMHIVCRQWQYEVSLTSANGRGFRYRTVHRVEIDGRPAAAAGPLAWNERLAGDDFALTIERLE